MSRIGQEAAQQKTSFASASTVLAIHGAGAGGWEFALWRAAFEARGWCFVAPDLEPCEDGLEATALAHYEEQVRTHIACHQPQLLIGASLGGLLALNGIQPSPQAQPREPPRAACWEVSASPQVGVNQDRRGSPVMLQEREQQGVRSTRTNKPTDGSWQLPQSAPQDPRASGPALALINPLPCAPWHSGLPARSWPARVLWAHRHDLAATMRALGDADAATAQEANRRWRDESGAVMNAAYLGVAISQRPRRLLMVIGSEDQDVPAATSLAMAQGLGADVLQLPGHGHVQPLLGRHAARIAEQVLGWYELTRGDGY